MVLRAVFRGTHPEGVPGGVHTLDLGVPRGSWGAPEGGLTRYPPHNILLSWIPATSTPAILTLSVTDPGYMGSWDGARWPEYLHNGGPQGVHTLDLGVPGGPPGGSLA
jgi:hypothetical protein